MAMNEENSDTHRKNGQLRSEKRHVILTVLNLILTFCMVVITSFLVHWTSKLWQAADQQAKAAKAQVTVAEAQVELMGTMNEDTKSLTKETIKYAREQTKASKLSADAARSSADAAKRTVQLTEESLKIHIDPEISCFLEEHPIKKGFLLFTVKNTGQIDAFIVSVNYRDFKYDKLVKKIKLGTFGSGDTYSEPGIRWMYLPRLSVDQRESKLTEDSARAPGGKYIDCLFYEISFYRDSDGRKYTKRCAYYIDGKNIYTESQFRSNEHYQFVQSELENFMQLSIQFPAGSTHKQ